MSKKTESTAVNDLLNLMATEGPRVMDPSADLFAEPPRKMPKGASGMFSMTSPPPMPSKNTRMSGKVPAMDSAGAVDPLPRRRAPLGTQSNTIPVPSRMSTVVPSRENTIPALEAAPPAPMNVRASRPSLPPPLPRTTTPPPMPRTSTQSLAAQVPPALAEFEVDVDVDVQPMVVVPVVAKPITNVQPTVAPASVEMTAGTAWFADSRAVATQAPFENTSKMHASRNARRELMKKLALPTIAMIVLGGAIGGYIAISRKSSTPATTVAATPALVTAPAAAPVAVPIEQKIETPVEQKVAAPAAQTIETPVAKPMVAKAALVDVRIDSTPSGAEVTLVDHGKTTFLGSTPISASVDPSHTYEVMLSYPNKPSKVEKLDPKTTQHLAVSFGKGAPVIETPKAAPVATRQHVEATAPKTEVAAVQPAKIEKTEPKIERTEPKIEKVAAASESGEGVLMLGSKPPCEITVDGKATGLMTPQRAMKLSVGKHTIKLASPDGEHSKTLSVEIKADKPTKVIEDLLGL